MKRCIILIYFFVCILVSCTDMIQSGIDSTRDPLLPEIVVKHEDVFIESNKGFLKHIAKNTEDTETINFTISNIGNADLEIFDVILKNSSDLFEIENLSELRGKKIKPGGVESLKIQLGPFDPGRYETIVIIKSNDFYEWEYIFTIGVRKLPGPTEG